MPKKARGVKQTGVNRQLQFVAIHNTALKNLARDETHAQRIAAKIKEEGDDLSDVRLEDLMKRRKELLLK